MAKVTFLTLYDNFSIGLRIMSSLLRAAGHDCSIIYFKLPKHSEIPQPDCNHQWYWLSDGRLFGHTLRNTFCTQREIDILLDLLPSFDADIIGISARSIFDAQACSLINIIKNKYPQTVLIAGGYGPTLNPSLYATEADYVAFGEGEDVIMDIANEYDNGRSLDEIPNLIFQRDTSVKYNPVRVPRLDIDSLPLPDYNNPHICYIDNDAAVQIDPALCQDLQDTHPIMIGRGCASACTYCSAGQWRALYSEHGHSLPPYRLRSLDGIMQELRMIKSRGYKRIQILDSFLTGPKPFLLDLFTRYAQDIALPFSEVNFDPNQIIRSPEILDAALAAGLQRASIGIQHGSQTFRSRVFRRNTSNSRLLQVASIYQSKGIETRYHIIAGIPLETQESLHDSLALVGELPMVNAGFDIFRFYALPHSPLHQILHEANVPPNTYDPGKVYITMLLYHFKKRIDEPIFTEIFERVSKLLFSSNTSDSGQQLVDSFFLILTNVLWKWNITLIEPFILLKSIYAAYLSQMKEQSVVIWGLEGSCGQLAELFARSNVHAIISDEYLDENLIRTIPNHASLPRLPSSCLAALDLPVFICSDSKPSICENIRTMYPHISFMP